MSPCFDLRKRFDEASQSLFENAAQGDNISAQLHPFRTNRLLIERPLELREESALPLRILQARIGNANDEAITDCGRRRDN